MISEGVPATTAEPVPSDRFGVGRRQRWLAWAAIAALLAAAIAVAPYDQMMLIAMPGLIPLFAASMFVVNLLLAALLFIKGSVEKRGDFTRLGAAYCFVCMIIVPYTASFPGGLLQAAVIGSMQTPVWLWCFWHIGFALAILRYAWFAGRETPPASAVLPSILVAALAVMGATYLATDGVAQLPPMIADGRFVVAGPALAGWGATTGSTLAALAVILRLRRTSEQLWLAVGLAASCLEIWLVLRGAARYTLGWDLARAGSLLASVTVLVSLLHDITRLYSVAAASNQKLEVLARLDSLTGLANRRRFDEALEQEWRRARRQFLPLSLVMLDVDSFKAYNDRYGHPMGDECLRRVAAAVKGAMWRPADQAARYGGEEFAVILPGTEVVGAALIAERIRAAVAALAIEHAGGSNGIVTISGGLASITPLRGDETPPAALVNAADGALYQAKRNGRNRVCAVNLGQGGPAGQAAAERTALAS